LECPDKTPCYGRPSGNRTIFKAAEKNPEHHGMGATLTAAWIDGAKLSIAHVGDSRRLFTPQRSLLQLTRDHSLVAEQVRRRHFWTAAEAEESNMQAFCCARLGAQAAIEVDAEEHTLFPRDVLLLCSDGLTRMVTEPENCGNAPGGDRSCPGSGKNSWHSLMSAAARTTLRYWRAGSKKIQGVVLWFGAVGPPKI